MGAADMSENSSLEAVEQHRLSPGLLLGPVLAILTQMILVFGIALSGSLSPIEDLALLSHLVPVFT